MLEEVKVGRPSTRRLVFATSPLQRAILENSRQDLRHAFKVLRKVFFFRGLSVGVEGAPEEGLGPALGRNVVDRGLTMRKKAPGTPRASREHSREADFWVVNEGNQIGAKKSGSPRR